MGLDFMVEFSYNGSVAIGVQCFLHSECIEAEHESSTKIVVLFLNILCC